jgi:prevent-host-death family protein
MITELPNIQELPRQNASQVKNKWADLVRQVRQSGSVAVTNHSAVEMVLLDASTYQQLTEEIQALKAREQTALDELTNRFNARLAVLQQPDAAQKLKSLFDAKGVLIGVGNGVRRPLPPNPVCGLPATGSPVSCFHIGIGAPIEEPLTS